MNEPGGVRRIAIADDSAAFAAAAAEHIASLPGYALAARPVIAGDALALVDATLPDVLLLDLGARPAQNLDLVRRVKAMPDAPAVVAMTLFDNPAAALAAQDAGADALLAKESFVPGLATILAELFPVALD